MKAIETKYNGYRFRSRLEARWAVFFDALGVRYEYEKQGYLVDGCPYLPDFWLPGLECWAEVKAQDPSKAEYALCSGLARDTDHPALMIVGTPGEERLLVYCADCTDSSGGEMWWGEFDDACERGPTLDPPRTFPAPHWSRAGAGGPVCLCSGNTWSSRSFLTSAYNAWMGMELAFDCDHTADWLAVLARAYAAARSARFEHGETPRPR